MFKMFMIDFWLEKQAITIIFTVYDFLKFIN